MIETGAQLILAERRRQIEVEGFDSAHDAGHGTALAHAAMCYIIASLPNNATVKPILWPFDAEYWKPTPGDPIRMLVKAGALIAAEIDRRRNAKVHLAAGEELDKLAKLFDVHRNVEADDSLRFRVLETIRKEGIKL